MGDECGTFFVVAGIVGIGAVAGLVAAALLVWRFS